MAVSVSTIVADMRTVITQLVDDLNGLHAGVSRSSLTTSMSTELGKGGYLVPTAGLATRGGLDRYRISPTHYQVDTSRSPRSKSAGRTLLQVLQKVLVVR